MNPVTEHTAPGERDAVVEATADRVASSDAIAHNHAYLREALRLLDERIRHRAVLLRRGAESNAGRADAHLYITHDEVDHLLTDPIDDETDILPGRVTDLENRQHRMAERAIQALRQGVFLGVPRLVALFGLSAFEEQALLICLAPELRNKYDTLYAYLQDDITRRRPTIDLVLELLCATEAERWEARASLTPDAPLFRFGLLQTVTDPQSPSGSSGLAQFVQLDPRILHFILGHQVMDARLMDVIRLRHVPAVSSNLAIDPEVSTSLLSFGRRFFEASNEGHRKLVVYLHGPYGAGRRELAQALCTSLGCGMLCVDAEKVTALGQDAANRLMLAFRESLLVNAPLFIERAEVFLKESEQADAFVKVLAQAVRMYGGLTLLSGTKLWWRRGVFEDAAFLPVALSMPPIATREQAWAQTLSRLFTASSVNGMAGALAQRFRLTPGQIQDAASAALDRHIARDGPIEPTFESLAAACRDQANHKLAELATKLRPHYGWDDLILPEDRRAQLREICAQVRHQQRVYEAWGFGNMLSYGKGLSALFSGPPGTGKTMAADVLAYDLRLDLYKVDLSRVVSKYIGETEKNLSLIFDEAENSNAILFFDEADALFGKRTSVSDAHDRYANIETSYLLQKMEEYDGIVILASNLRENMDDAFVRRIRFIVDFPFPDASIRLQIWRGHFPDAAPVSENVDYELLAERVQVAGGNIKNIALNAAFFAAEEGDTIGMKHILQGVRREYEKIGKLWDARAFVR